MISWKGASPFSGGRGEGVVFQMGEGGFIFKWGVRPMGGIGFDGGGSKKFVGGGRGGAAPIAPSMGNPERYGGFIHFHLVCTL